MPTPASQRLELLCVLRKARELRCTCDIGGDVGLDGTDVAGEGELVEEDQKEMDVRAGGREGINGGDVQMRKLERRLDPEKRHLEWLVPLVSRVGRLARHDKEIADACMAVMDAAIDLS